ncbi:MAG: DVUA0089 family protein [Planctomycetaceae bacterium]
MFKLRKRPAKRAQKKAFSTEGAEVLEVRKLLSASDPNDQIVEAMNVGQITSQQTWTGAIDPKTDVDMYKFNVTAGQKVRFTISTSGGLEPRLRVFGTISSGRPPQEMTSRTGSFEYTFTNGGTYYLGLSESANRFYSPTTGRGDRFAPDSRTGTYSLRFSTPSPGDRDDQISEAIDLGRAKSKTRSVRGRIGNSTDVDMYKFRVGAGQRVRFDIDKTTGGLDSYLRLFDSRGQQLNFNDDGVGPRETRGLDSYFEHTFTSSGTFFVGVSAYGNQEYNAVTGGSDNTARTTGNFTLRMKRLSTGDPDDQIREATSLGGVSSTRTKEASGSISNGKDVDMYSFSITAQHTVRIRAQGMHLRLFYLRDGRLTEWAAGDSFISSGTGLGGTLYVSVSGIGNTEFDPVTGTGDRPGSTGRYTLTVSATRR